eukprot:3380900-Pleurochrysis_carterae.AAC.1
MADVWSTHSWAERHFSEGIGFWEVNVYKTLTYFYPKEKGLMHGEFRARLAWTLMTLGRAGAYKDGKMARSTTPEPPDTAGSSE